MLKQLHRSAYFDISKNAKIMINVCSPINVECLLPHEADRDSVQIPDNSLFKIVGNNISQSISSISESESTIKIPVKRDVDIVLQNASPLNFQKYEGLNASINSHGPVNLRKLRLFNLCVHSLDNISSVGYIEGNFSAFTIASMNFDNLTCENIELLFGGPACNVKSAYCESMTLKSIVPELSSDGVTPAEQMPLDINFGTLHGNVNVEIDGTAELNIGSFEGTLKLRQRLGKVSLHIAGPCPLLEIDVAEGDIEISLPIDSASPSTVNGLLDISASSIKLDKNTTPEDALDNWDISEGPGEQRFCGSFGPKTDEEPLWRIRTLRGTVKVSCSSWADAMMRNLGHVGQAPIGI